MSAAIHKGNSSRSSLLGLLVASASLLLPACEWDGNFTVLGYTTRPNYDASVQTVRIPVIKNLVLQDTVRRGMEFELTEAVKRQVRERTPFKVVGDNEPADTELVCTIVGYNKQMLNRNQLNEVREAENVLLVDVIWRDLRCGAALDVPPAEPASATGSGSTVVVPLDSATQPQTISPPSQPQAPGGGLLNGIAPAAPPGVRRELVQGTARFIPELGESPTTSRKRAIDNLAVQIVSMMEMPW
jgi:hypothetical protein